MTKRKNLILLMLGFVLLTGVLRSACAAEVRVAVAANFTIPMRQISALFEQQSGDEVKLSFGSSGKLTAQIKQGAPFDVFLSADVKKPKLLEEEGLAVKGSRFVYALGKLVLWSAQAGYVDDKGTVLGKGEFKKLAYSDPKLAPYGLAAKQSLQKMGLWNEVKAKLVTGESIAQTYQFAASGNAELGFVAMSQIIKDGKVRKGSWWPVPTSMYQPINQAAVQLTAAKDPLAAKALLDFLKSEKAVMIMRSFGYELP